MIRFIRIGNQITQESNEFAFFDTITETFVDVFGSYTFDSRDDLKFYLDHCQYTEEFKQRLIGLIPKDIE